MNVSFQVSTPEMADVTKYRSEAKVFWQKTEELLNELQKLQRDIQSINCPCTNPDCPFNSKNTRADSELYFQFPDLSSVQPRLRKNGTYYNGFPNGQFNMALQILGEDCEVANDEPTSFSDITYEFKRAKPVKRKKHSLQVTRSFSPECLSVPLPPIYSPTGRSLSMPTGIDSKTGSGFAKLQQSRAYRHSPSCNRLSFKTA